MRTIKMLSVVLGILIFSGCVSTEEHKARLSDIDNLKKDVSVLEEKLKTREGEKAALKAMLEANKDELTRDLVSTKAKLSEKEQKIKELENELKSKNAQITELKTEIAGLSKEKSQAIEEKDKAVAELKKTYTNLVDELKDEIKKGEIAVTQLRDKLSLSMVDKILFDSGSADVKKDGKKVLDRVAEILKKVTDKQIRIEGHTDNVKIGPRIAKKFPTNWELSNARATNVLRYLQEKGVDPKLLSPAGYAEYKPIESNDTEEGKSKNRRIEIVLIPVDSDRIAK
ncbi:MAG: OmpA family protein [Nitrospirae bacterium]|nr:OmpA family protein [Nitrospirota bacterium]